MKIKPEDPWYKDAIRMKGYVQTEFERVKAKDQSRSDKNPTPGEVVIEQNRPQILLIPSKKYSATLVYDPKTGEPVSFKCEKSGSYNGTVAYAEGAQTYELHVANGKTIYGYTQRDGYIHDSGASGSCTWRGTLTVDNQTGEMDYSTYRY